MQAEMLSKSALARSLGVSRQSLYYVPKRSRTDEILRDQILSIQDKHPAYGYRRVAWQLGINKKRTARVMKKYHLKARLRRKKRTYLAIFSTIPNRLRDLAVSHPNEAWCGDFTYLWFRGRYIYLATVIDYFTREVIAWQIGLHHTTSLVIDVLEEAKRKREKNPQIFHSDQGSEYTAQECLAWLTKNGILPSNSPKGKPWCNGRQESFFSQFKLEFAKPSCFTTLESLIEAIGKYIHYYNTERIHSAHRTSPRAFFVKCQQKEKPENPRD
jgi:putative transposase